MKWTENHNEHYLQRGAVQFFCQRKEEPPGAVWSAFWWNKPTVSYFICNSNNLEGWQDRQPPFNWHWCQLEAVVAATCVIQSITQPWLQAAMKRYMNGVFPAKPRCIWWLCFHECSKGRPVRLSLDGVCDCSRYPWLHSWAARWCHRGQVKGTISLFLSSYL